MFDDFMDRRSQQQVRILPCLFALNGSVPSNSHCRRCIADPRMTDLHPRQRHSGTKGNEATPQRYIHSQYQGVALGRLKDGIIGRVIFCVVHK